MPCFSFLLFIVCNLLIIVRADLLWNSSIFSPNVNLVGSASFTQNSNTIQLTQQLDQVGAIWWNDKQIISDGFDVLIGFTVAENNDPQERFAFVIQNYGVGAISNPSDYYGCEFPSSLAFVIGYYNITVQYTGYDNQTRILLHKSNNIDDATIAGGDWEVRVRYTAIDKKIDIIYPIDDDAYFAEVFNFNVTDYVPLDQTGAAWIGLTGATGNRGHFVQISVSSFNFSNNHADVVITNPGTPSNFRVTDRRADSIIVIWEAAEQGYYPIQYYLLRITDSNNVSDYINVSMSATSYQFTNLLPRHNYSFSICAVDTMQNPSEWYPAIQQQTEIIELQAPVVSFSYTRVSNLSTILSINWSSACDNCTYTLYMYFVPTAAYLFTPDHLLHWDIEVPAMPRPYAFRILARYEEQSDSIWSNIINTTSPGCLDGFCDINAGENAETCPEDCLDTCEAGCDMKKGYCEYGLCVCYSPYSGPHCTRKTRGFDYALRAKEAAIDITADEDIFSFGLLDLSEFSPSTGTYSYYHDCPLKLTTSTQNFAEYSCIFISNAAFLQVTIQKFNTGVILPFARQSISLPEHSVKFTILIRNWPFKSNRNSLRIRMIAGSAEIRPATYGNGWLEIGAPSQTSSKTTMFAKFARNALLDDIPGRIQTTYATNGTITLTIPHFWKSVVIDPDVSLLVQGTKNGVDWKIILGIVIACVLVAAIIVVLGLRHYNKQKKEVDKFFRRKQTNTKNTEKKEDEEKGEAILSNLSISDEQ